MCLYTTSNSTEYWLRAGTRIATRAAASLGHRRLEATGRMPLCTLAMALATGKTTSEFSVLDRNELRVDTYFSRSPDCEAAGFKTND